MVILHESDIAFEIRLHHQNVFHSFKQYLPWNAIWTLQPALKITHNQSVPAFDHLIKKELKLIHLHFSYNGLVSTKPSISLFHS
jgi:hypothetical protein